MRINIRIDNNKRYQKIEGFGASGAWWSQDVGNWDNIEEIMDLLYDKKKGIGLNIYRYNIGAGLPSYARDAWRRSETLESGSGVYDLSRDAAAIKVFKLAAERGAVHNVLFANSPPARMTVSGYTSGGNNKRESNLAQEHEVSFARYCADITRLIIDAGLPVKYLSPINEPQWDWGGRDASQEGCHYKLEQVIRVGRAVAQELEKQGLPVKISLAESGKWNDTEYTFGLYDLMLEDKALRELVDHYAVHSYWSNEADKKTAAEFFKSKSKILPLHQTEWCQMQGGIDLGMDAAIIMAKEIHADLTILSVISWSHWLGVSCYDYKDGLVYVNRENRSYQDSRRMWALGNYSRFIKEDYVRIEAELDNDMLSASAYQSPDGRETVAVIINETQSAQELAIDYFDTGITRVYITDENNICRDVFEKISGVRGYEIPARSVVTFVNLK